MSKYPGTRGDPKLGMVYTRDYKKKGIKQRKSGTDKPNFSQKRDMITARGLVGSRNREIKGEKRVDQDALSGNCPSRVRLNCSSEGRRARRRLQSIASLFA